MGTPLTGQIPRTRGCTPIVTIEDNCVDGPAARMSLAGLWSANSAPEVTGHGGHRKMGGLARTCWRWTLVNGDLVAGGGGRTSTKEHAIFTSHVALPGVAQCAVPYTDDELMKIHSLVFSNQ